MARGVARSCSQARCDHANLLVATAKACSLGTVEIGYVFGVKADSMGIALALIIHGQECGKG